MILAKGNVQEAMALKSASLDTYLAKLDNYVKGIEAAPKK
jgi:hypothetical protein